MLIMKPNSIWDIHQTAHNAAKQLNNVQVRNETFYTDLDVSLRRFIGKTAGLALLHGTFLPIRLAEKVVNSDGITQSEFATGLYSVIVKYTLAEFDTSEKLSLLISGSSGINVTDWKKNTKYIDKTTAGTTLSLFWKVISSFIYQTRRWRIQVFICSCLWR